MNMSSRIYIKSKMQLVRFRVARPTNNLELLCKFYVNGLGMREHESFSGHSGYDGKMFKAQDDSWEIEFTQHIEGSPSHSPSPDNLLVFYVVDRLEVNAIAARFKLMGIEPVVPANPYWLNKGLTFEDPDGWRIVVVDNSIL